MVDAWSPSKTRRFFQHAAHYSGFAEAGVD